MYKFKFWRVPANLTSIVTWRVVVQIIKMNGAAFIIAKIIVANMNSFNREDPLSLIIWH